MRAFIKILKSFNIQLLADIRSFPGSKRFPQYNKENLLQTLPQYGISYQHFPGLGGRRKASKDSKNIAWKNEAYSGYADYMESETFKTEIVRLEEIALKQATAYMCSEAVWWRCHRSLVSDYLKYFDWLVLHIMGENKTEVHPYTSAARIVNGKLDYSGKQNLLF
ncbi:MAG: DUF488 domain-containing protein [Parafilimonas sp.]